jgi:multidrug efflux system outer membrane protein
LVRSRFNGGIGNDLDIVRAETELATTEAEAAALAQQRAELENTIAILVGSNPASLHLAAADPGNWNPPTPEIPAGLPSDLLERRTDVAQAERQLASANARIGVANHRTMARSAHRRTGGPKTGMHGRGGICAHPAPLAPTAG